MFIINTQSDTPIFEQIKKQILEFISIGILSADDKLPSVRSLASSIGINPNTVVKAYQELEAQGYIYKIQGKGCFISNHEPIQMIKKEKENEFRNIVMEMKRFGICQVELISIIQHVYREENLYDSNNIFEKEVS